MGEQSSLRVATIDDAELLLTWRNDEETRHSSRQQEPITYAAHVAWLTAALSDQDRLVRVLVVEGEPVASVRFDRAPRKDGSESGCSNPAEVSIVVAPEARGHGYGQAALSKGHAVLLERWPTVHEVEAVVHEDNQPSRRLFEREGYALTDGPDEQGWLSYRWRALRDPDASDNR